MSTAVARRRSSSAHVTDTAALARAVRAEIVALGLTPGLGHQITRRDGRLCVETSAAGSRVRGWSVNGQVVVHRLDRSGDPVAPLT